MYYVILSSQWKDNTKRTITLKRCVLCWESIKRAVCSLPLAPNAQRTNLHLTSNPLTRRGLMHAEYTVYTIGYIQTVKKTLYMCIHWKMQSPKESPVLLSPKFLLTPHLCSHLSPPCRLPTDGLPLTEHWHQMCSSSVDSGTSWAECASGSVNESGSALCALVCVCMLVCAVCCRSVACDSWETLCGWGLLTVSHSELHCSSTQPCSAQQQTHHIQLPIQNKHSPSIYFVSPASFYRAVCFIICLSQPPIHIFFL